MHALEVTHIIIIIIINYQFYPKKGYTKGLEPVQGGSQQKKASLQTKTRTKQINDKITTDI